MFYAIHVQGTE